MSTLEAKGKGKKLLRQGKGKMLIERICGATFLVSIFESRFWEKVAPNQLITH